MTADFQTGPIRVLYATTREVTYARNETLVGALRRHAHVEVIAPAGSGRGFDDRVAYVWGIARVVFRLLARSLRWRRTDDVLVVGFLAQPLALVVAPFWQGRIVADAMVSVFDTICHDKRIAAPQSVIGRTAWWLDAYLVRHADALLFDTQQHREYFARFASGPLPPSYVVPVGARKLKPAHGRKDTSERLQVLFAGSYIPLQGAGVIVRAASLLQDEPIDITMIGAGQEYKAVRSVALDQGLRNVRFIGWLSLDALDEFYSRADVILGIFGPSPKTQRVIPNKVFEAFSIGQPVITGDTPAIRELFVPGREVMCCPVNDPAGLAEAIRWALAHRQRLPDIGQAGQQAFQRHASECALAESLRPLFDAAPRRAPAQSEL